MSDPISEPPIDTEAALACTDGDADLLQSLIELYFDQQATLIGQIRAGIDGRDGHAVERGAHSLKGAVSVFAAPGARQAAFDLENIGREARWDVAEPAWNRLQTELERFEPALRHLNDSILRGDLSDV